MEGSAQRAFGTGGAIMSHRRNRPKRVAMSAWSKDSDQWPTFKDLIDELGHSHDHGACTLTADLEWNLDVEVVEAILKVSGRKPRKEFV